MTLQILLLWLAIGLVAGWAAHTAMGGGFGLAGDAAIGIAGAILATVLFDALDVQLPLLGLASKILVAFVGAVLLLGVSRVFTRSAAAGG